MNALDYKKRHKKKAKIKQKKLDSEYIFNLKKKVI